MYRSFNLFQPLKTLNTNVKQKKTQVDIDHSHNVLMTVICDEIQQFMELKRDVSNKNDRHPNHSFSHLP